MLQQVESHHPASWQPLTRPTNREGRLHSEKTTHALFCPLLSSGILNSRLLQRCVIKLTAIHWFDLCATNFTAQGSLTSASAFTKTVCKWGLGPWEHAKDVQLWCFCSVRMLHRLSSNPHRGKCSFLGAGRLTVLRVFCMSREFAWLCASRNFQCAELLIDYALPGREK